MKESELIKKAKTESIVKYGEVNDDFLDGVKFILGIRRTGRNRKPVRRIGLRDSEEYESITQASREMGCTYNTIWLALKEDRVALGYRWEYL